MKIEIEIGDDSPFVQALAAEISKSKVAASTSGEDSSKGEEGFELKRAGEAMALTCVALSCGIS